MVTLGNKGGGEDSLPTERGGWLLLTPVTLLRELFCNLRQQRTSEPELRSLRCPPPDREGGSVNSLRVEWCGTHSEYRGWSGTHSEYREWIEVTHSISIW